MKKKLLSIISLLVAFVMCFALVACEETNTPSGGPSNELPADKTVEAIEDLVTTHGYKLTLKTTQNSDKTTTPPTSEQVFEKKGDVLRIEGAEVDTYLNLATGYMYREVSDGVYGYDQFLPAGYVSYLADVVKGLIPSTAADKAKLYETLKDNITYDGKTKTGTYKLSLKDVVNGLLAPVEEAYADGETTVSELIDEYLGMFITNEDLNTLEKLIDALIDSYDDYKEVTLGSLIAGVDEALGISVKDIVLRFAPIDEAGWSQIEDAEIGEVCVALLRYIETKMPATQDETADEGGEGDDGMMGMIMETLMEAFQFMMDQTDITTEEINAVPEKLDAFKDMILGMLDGMTVKQTVDNYGAMLPADVVLLISEGVKLTALDAEVKFTFDDNYKFSKITLNALFAHDYVAKQNDGAMFLADNNYLYTLEATISDYATTGEYTFTVTERDENPGYVQVSALVKAGSTDGTFDFYYEEAGTVTVTDCKLVNVIGTEYAGTSDAVAYDETTKTFSVKYSALSTIINGENFYTEQGVIVMMAKVEYDEGETYDLIVTFFVAKDTSVGTAVKTSVPMIMSLVGNIMGGFGSDSGYAD